MATQTANYRLIKPDYTDPVDVGVLNTNADLIDAALTDKEDLSNKTDTVSSTNPSSDKYPSEKGVVDYTAAHSKHRLIAQQTLEAEAPSVEFELTEAVTSFTVVAKTVKGSSATALDLFVGTSVDDEVQLLSRALGTGEDPFLMADVNFFPGVAIEASGIYMSYTPAGETGTRIQGCYADSETLPPAITFIEVHFSRNVSAGTEVSIFTNN